MEEYKLIGEFDARVWAREWIERIKVNPAIPTDEECMVGWFANAIMSGYDIGRRDATTTPPPAPKEAI